jgi:hypothetical protein
MNYNDLEYKQQKSKVLSDINNYINHSFIVYSNSRFGWKEDTLNEITVIKNFICDLNKYSSLFQICLKIFRLKKRLFKILPNPKNKSYLSQYKKLTEIINFSTEFIKPKKAVKQTQLLF